MLAAFRLVLPAAVVTTSLLAQSPPWGDVRAVIEQRCLSCHGGEKVESGMRFATAATFAVGGHRGAVIDREDPTRSRMLAAITYADPEIAMPPDGRLPDDEIEVLRRWIVAGAPWPDGEQLADPERFADEHDAFDLRAGAEWWAYRPLVESNLPAGVHPIDALIAAGLEGAHLAPAPRASAATLIRRATFDLTGLPPTPAEVAAFVVASERDADAAWAALIDRLLGSPHHGEHQARRWLDLVRYAETNGYERDGAKTNMWRYRDWVIRAFANDLPYDHFVLAQLAGDELRDELDVDDLGDPRLATGYYRLGVWDDEPADPAQALADELADIVDTTGQVFLGTTMGCARCHDHKADPITQRDYYAFTAFFNNVRGYGGGTFGQHLGGGVTTDIADQPGEDLLAAGERERRIAEVDEQLAPLLAELRAKAPAVTSAMLVGDARTQPAVWRHHDGVAPEGWAAQSFDDSAWREGAAGFGTEGTPGARVGTKWQGKRIQLRHRFRLTEIPSGVILSLYHDEDVAVFVNGRQVLERAGYRTDYTDVQLDAAAMDALVVGSNVIAVHCKQTVGGQFVDVGVRTGWLDDDAALRTRLAREGEQWLPAERAARGRALLDERARVADLPIAAPYPAQVVSEFDRAPQTQHVLMRGSVHAPGDVVTAAVPATLRFTAAQPAPPPQPTRASSGRRAALARWLVGPGRFLTARVQANRLWQQHFGRGLCRSAGDFGKLGEAPTHPELLDHLASELIARDWSLFALHRYIMSSEAYRQASVGSAEALAADPRNELFWRQDPRRLTAEEYRDAVLAVSGELRDERFGPSVRPPLPAEVLATASRPEQAWPESDPADAQRRSLYVFVKRSLRMPLLEALDQPDPDLPCPVRFPTNVPTQALMTLNGAFVHEAAASFAQRLRREAGTLREQVQRGLEIALQRPADPDEVARHVAFCERLGDDAALDLFCVALFNLNEFVWID